MTMTTDRRLTTARDLGDLIRSLRPDARATGLAVTDDWCRDQMHDLGVSRYEDVTPTVAGTIADRVDRLADDEEDDE